MPPSRNEENVMNLNSIDDCDVISPAELAQQRWNSSRTALGKLTRFKICGVSLYCSPDSYMLFVPTVITYAIVFGNMATCWNTIGTVELTVTCILLALAAVCSLLLVCTDPGVYPRLRMNEPDPLGDDTTLVYCRICELRRPPRTSHCYICNVCVQEHDHHCGVLGGCVGVRSLRWFTSYLVCTSLATLMGFFWSVRFLATGVFSTSRPPRVRNRDPLRVRAGGPPLAHGMGTREVTMHRTEVDTDVGFADVAAIFVLIVDMVVVLMVGALACIYLYLSLTSTTRRESQKKDFSVRACCSPAFLARNFKRTAFPQKSLLVSPTPEYDNTLSHLV